MRPWTRRDCRHREIGLHGGWSRVGFRGGLGCHDGGGRLILGAQGEENGRRHEGQHQHQWSQGKSLSHVGSVVDFPPLWQRRKNTPDVSSSPCHAPQDQRMGDVGENNRRHADEKPRMHLAVFAEHQRRHQDAIDRLEIEREV
jgi:hypothetical protein